VTAHGFCRGRRVVIRVVSELLVDLPQVSFDPPLGEAESASFLIALLDKPSETRVKIIRSRGVNWSMPMLQRPLAKRRLKYVMPIGTSNAASAVSTDSVSGRWLGLLIPM